MVDFSRFFFGGGRGGGLVTCCWDSIVKKCEGVKSTSGFELQILAIPSLACARRFIRPSFLR